MLKDRNRHGKVRRKKAKEIVALDLSFKMTPTLLHYTVMSAPLLTAAACAAHFVYTHIRTWLVLIVHVQ